MTRPTPTSITISISISPNTSVSISITVTFPITLITTTVTTTSSSYATINNTPTSPPLLSTTSTHTDCKLTSWGFSVHLGKQEVLIRRELFQGGG